MILQKIDVSMGSDSIGFRSLNDCKVKVHFLVYMAVFNNDRILF